jgi:hypothetical protein
MSSRKKLILLGFLAGFPGLAAWTLAQSPAGQKASYPVQGSGLAVFPTPMPSAVPKSFFLRPARPTATVVRNRFFPLNPKAKPTPPRGQKLKTQNKGKPATVSGPRDIHYPSLYQDPR